MVSELNLYKSLSYENTCLNPYCLGGWSRSEAEEKIKMWQERVLILIVLEDGLGEAQRKRCEEFVKVLILIVLEDGLGDNPLLS